jgi:hypothetical protein
MGVAKELEVAKGEIAKIKALVDKTLVSDAKKAAEVVAKKLDTIIANFNKKMSLNMSNIQKLDTAITDLIKALSATPYQSKKALDAIGLATTTANAAVTAAKTD